ncbi:MAG: MerR family transcriptional regulator, partial [Bacteroidales bacterium]|nr:MerR family transcriptional regulator [Bacteroidales bacterium]
MQTLGWQAADIILVSGDAFVDHPSFGTAVIARVLEKEGFKVAVIPQPNWQDDLRDFKKLGKPNLFFGVSAGNMDSMINHYTAAKRKRSDDAYTAGGKAGQRPDYASNVYSNILKQLYPETPVILGGIEASMRRFAHYDFWQDKILNSILISSKADLLVYGMGEQSIREIAKQLKETNNIKSCYNIKQCARLDMIQYMKELGMSLKQIKEHLDRQNISVIQEVLKRQKKLIDE